MRMFLFSFFFGTACGAIMLCFQWPQAQLFPAATGRIFSHVRPFYEPAVSDFDRSMYRSL